MALGTVVLHQSGPFRMGLRQRGGVDAERQHVAHHVLHHAFHSTAAHHSVRSHRARPPGPENRIQTDDADEAYRDQRQARDQGPAPIHRSSSRSSWRMRV